MIATHIHRRLLIIFTLGFSSGLPLALLSSTLQAWFSDSGLSIWTTGSISLLGIPYLCRVLWAPLLDRYSLLPIGKRRSWMLMTQLLLLIGFHLLAWCSPTTSPRLIMILAFFLACFSAIQDIAIDAHRTEYLPENEHALGASVAVLGYRLGLFVAGGLALIVAARWGWACAYRMMSLMMLVGITATFCSSEPSLPITNVLSMTQSFLIPAKEMLSRPSITALLLFIFFYKLGEAFTTTTSGIVMPFLIQGIGFPLDTIAYVNKIMGVGSVLMGGLSAGILLMRWPLYRALLVFGLLQAGSNSLFVLLAMAGKNVPLFALAVVCDNFAAGMGSTAIIALFMRLVDRHYTATQFSIFVVLATIPRVLSGPIAAYLQSHLGWIGLYQVSFLLSLGFIPFLMNIRVLTMIHSDQKK
jgi:PAT family beta-lactamase induction signal transducer AmpG